MAMTPRILLISAVGIVLYLVLSLYHGHQLRKYPAAGATGGQLSARTQEKNWVQVSTGQIIGPEQPPATLPGQATPLIAGEEDSAVSDQGRSPGTSKESAPEDNEPQAELQRLRAELVRERAELQEARTRAVIAEEELNRARLKAEAMFKFGQEQSRLLAPARQEAELLSARLQETSGKLRQAEQQISVLRAEVSTLRPTSAAGPNQAIGAEGGSSTAAPAPAD